MRIGVVFPQSEIGTDPAAIRAYATAAAELGYTHALVYDHVLGADPDVHREWRGPYDIDTTFHEPFVLFGFLAAAAPALELVSGIVILPQRQTALVAKQAAEVDVLTGGRFRLGVGIGWNHVEYDSLGMDFRTRGRRIEEQVELLRRLWTERSVSFEGEFDVVKGAGISPLPVQRPIPLWVGGSSVRAYERMGRIADGWFPQVPPGPKLDEALVTIARAAAAAGRDPSSIAMEGRVNVGAGAIDKLVDHVSRWRDVGATHVSINTMGAGLRSVDEHVALLTEASTAIHSPA